MKSWVFQFLFSRKKPKQDELVGIWATENDGGIHMLFGSTIQFNQNGTGFSQHWGSSPVSADPEDGEADYCHENSFFWKRTGPKSILIQKTGEEEWAPVPYTIRDYTGAYGLSYFRLTQDNFKPIEPYFKEGFWDILYPVLKSKNQGRFE